MFVAPDGRVFNAGPNSNTGFLTTSGTGGWQDVGQHRLANAAATGLHQYDLGQREAGTAVMYQPGKVLIIGGMGTGGVTNTTELIDLTEAAPQFRYAAPMQLPRTHVNATLLPDGTVLVTGGTTSNNNDANAVLPAELWTPPTTTAPGGTWRTVAAMRVPRLYHSTALLLPNGRVLSTGGGQGGGFTDHPDAELYSPPYLFNGARPSISAAPPVVSYGQQFTVSTPHYAQIARVTWLRLSSVTHSINMDQRFNELAFAVSGSGLSVTAPPDDKVSPPGHYLLFVLNQAGVPSVARIVSIGVNNCPPAASLRTTTVTADLCSATMRVEPVGSNLGSNYRWTVDGVYDPSLDGQYSIDLSLDPQYYSAEVSVTVSPACGGTPATLSTTVTRYFRKCVQ